MNNLSRHAVSGSRNIARARHIISHPLGLSTSFVRHSSTETPGPPSTSKPSGSPTEHAQHGDAVEAMNAQGAGYPDLMQPDILLDLHESKTFPPGRRSRFQNKVTVRNDPSMFVALREQMKEADPEGYAEAQRLREERAELSGPYAFLHLTASEIAGLFRYPVIRRRVVQQTGKGKIPRQHVVMVVGNQNGLVGIGEGKAHEAQLAMRAALAAAVRNMDYIERFEDRTLWTEMETKFASTRVILRPRPVGFGLRCNPNVYQVLKAAGIKDASAKVWGSRNPLQVVRAVVRMLMPGHAPIGLGNGIGGGGRRLDKGSGMRAKEDLERERGRKLVPLRL